jgi:hypothetical protein
MIPEINASFKIYNGGPRRQSFYPYQSYSNSIEISNGIYWGEILEA